MSVTPGIVAFNAAAFIAQFPAFATVPTFNGSGSLTASSDVLTVNSVTSGALRVGDAVFDASGALPVGTTISSFGTGTGGTGTYNLSQVSSQTVSADQIVVSQALAFNFNLATLQLNNSLGSIVQDAPTRAQLLNLVTAHITALLNGVNGEPPAGTVGRISSATQGSISVQTDFKTDSEAAAYYNQTQWGATYWLSTAVYRTMHYRRPRLYEDASWGAWPE